MSGGSWDYFYYKLEEVAEKLSWQDNPLRKAMGKKLKEAAAALHDIEWVDSSDYGEGDDVKAIKKFLGKNPEGIIAQEQVKRIKKLLKD